MIKSKSLVKLSCFLAFVAVNGVTSACSNSGHSSLDDSQAAASLVLSSHTLFDAYASNQKDYLARTGKLTVGEWQASFNDGFVKKVVSIDGISADFSRTLTRFTHSEQTVAELWQELGVRPDSIDYSQFASALTRLRSLPPSSKLSLVDATDSDGSTTQGQDSFQTGTTPIDTKARKPQATSSSTQSPVYGSNDTAVAMTVAYKIILTPNDVIGTRYDQILSPCKVVPLKVAPARSVPCAPYKAAAPATPQKS